MSGSKIHNLLTRYLGILLLTTAAIISLFFIKDPSMRTPAIILFIISFTLLYTFVVRRRTDNKKTENRLRQAIAEDLKRSRHEEKQTGSRRKKV
ncbi:MAG: hypothetical protein A2176_02235 [Spirochaetes bacterium RBG_13_51_14]|nr:MAG: hypothetical protein A2176_02235 [Spirochaetes bacterium RBG_13_51_14]